MSALLLCPFCGGDAHVGHTKYSRPVHDACWDDGSPITETFWGHCASCCGSHRGGPVGGHRTHERAVTAWNARAPLSGIPTEDIPTLLGEVREVIAPFDHFIRMYDAKPPRAMADDFYGIHAGEQWEASLRLSELRRLSALLAKLGSGS